MAIDVDLRAWDFTPAEDDDWSDAFAIDLSRWRPELHPRDSHGRFRNTWRLPESAMADVERLLRGFNPPPLRSDRHASSYLKGQRGPRSQKQQEALDYFLSRAGNEDIQSTLRAKYDPARDKDVPQSEHIRELDGMMRPLEHDLILSRVMGPDAFGLPPERMDEVEEWTGRRAADAGFSPMNAGSAHVVDGPHIEMRILVPKGTRAIIVGDGGDGPNSRTVILDRNQPIRIGKMQKDGRGGFYAMATVAPSRGAKGERPVMQLGRELPVSERSPAIAPTPDEFQRRGLEPDMNAPGPQEQPERFGPVTGPGPAPVAKAAPAGASPAPTPAPQGPPLEKQRLAPEQIPTGAGKVTTQEDLNAPPAPVPEPTPAKRGGPGRQVIPEAEARLRDRETREIARQKMLDEREARLQKAQEQMLLAREREIARKDARIQQLEQERQAANEARTIRADEGTRAMAQPTIPEKEKRVVEADEKHRKEPGWPHTGEDTRIARHANEIRRTHGQPELPIPENAPPPPGEEVTPAKKARRVIKKAAPEAAPEVPAPTKRTRKAAEKAAPEAAPEAPPKAAPEAPAAPPTKRARKVAQKAAPETAPEAPPVKKAAPQAPAKAAPEVPAKAVPEQAPLPFQPRRPRLSKEDREADKLVDQMTDEQVMARQQEIIKQGGPKTPLDWANQRRRDRISRGETRPVVRRAAKKAAPEGVPEVPAKKAPVKRVAKKAEAVAKAAPEKKAIPERKPKTMAELQAMSDDEIIRYVDGLEGPSQNSSEVVAKRMATAARARKAEGAPSGETVQERVARERPPELRNREGRPRVSGGGNEAQKAQADRIRARAEAERPKPPEGKKRVSGGGNEEQRARAERIRARAEAERPPQKPHRATPLTEEEQLRAEAEQKAPRPGIKKAESKVTKLRAENFDRNTPNVPGQDGALLRLAQRRLAEGQPIANIKKDLQDRADFHRRNAEIERADPNDLTGQLGDRYERLADIYQNAADSIGKRGPNPERLTPGDKVERTNKDKSITKGTVAKRGRLTYIDWEDGESQRVLPSRPGRGIKKVGGAEPGIEVPKAAKAPTLTELRKEASTLGVPGRSRMDKGQLEEAVAVRRKKEGESDQEHAARLVGLNQKPTVTRAAPRKVAKGAPEAARPSREDRVASALLDAMPPEARKRILDSMTPDERAAVDQAVQRVKAEARPTVRRVTAKKAVTKLADLTPDQRRQYTDLSPQEQASYRAFLRNGRSHDDALQAARDMVNARTVKAAKAAEGPPVKRAARKMAKKVTPEREIVPAAESRKKAAPAAEKKLAKIVPGNVKETSTAQKRAPKATGVQGPTKAAKVARPTVRRAAPAKAVAEAPPAPEVLQGNSKADFAPGGAKHLDITPYAKGMDLGEVQVPGGSKLDNVPDHSSLIRDAQRQLDEGQTPGQVGRELQLVAARIRSSAVTRFTDRGNEIGTPQDKANKKATYEAWQKRAKQIADFGGTLEKLQRPRVVRKKAAGPAVAKVAPERPTVTRAAKKVAKAAPPARLARSPRLTPEQQSDIADLRAIDKARYRSLRRDHVEHDTALAQVKRERQSADLGAAQRKETAATERMRKVEATKAEAAARKTANAKQIENRKELEPLLKDAGVEWKDLSDKQRAKVGVLKGRVEKRTLTKKRAAEMLREDGNAHMDAIASVLERRAPRKVAKAAAPAVKKAIPEAPTKATRPTVTRAAKKVAEAAPEVPATKTAKATGVEPSMEGRVRPNGMIPLGKLQKGDRIMVRQGADGNWHPSSRIGDTPITVDRTELVARSGGFRRTTNRMAVIGHDDQGHEVRVGTGTISRGKGYPGHQTFRAARPRPAEAPATPVKRAARKVAAKAAAPEAPAKPKTYREQVNEIADTKAPKDLSPAARFQWAAAYKRRKDKGAHEEIARVAGDDAAARSTAAAAKKATPEAPPAPLAKRAARKVAKAAPEAPTKAERPTVTRAAGKAAKAAAPEAPPAPPTKRVIRERKPTPVGEQSPVTKRLLGMNGDHDKIQAELDKDQNNLDVLREVAQDLRVDAMQPKPDLKRSIAEALTSGPKKRARKARPLAEPLEAQAPETPFKKPRKVAIKIPPHIAKEKAPEGVNVTFYHRARAAGMSKPRAEEYARARMQAKEEAAKATRALKEPIPYEAPRKPAPEPERPTVKRVAKKVAAALTRPFTRRAEARVPEKSREERLKESEAALRRMVQEKAAKAAAENPRTRATMQRLEALRSTEWGKRGLGSLTPAQRKQWEDLGSSEARNSYRVLRNNNPELTHDEAIAAVPKALAEHAARISEREAAARATKKAARTARKVAAGVPERPTVTRAGKKVESADDVIANRGTVVRTPEHKGWDIVEHAGNKRWYILDPEGKLHKDGRISSSSSLENAQKRLDRIDKPAAPQAPAKRVRKAAAKAVPEAAAPEAPAKRVRKVAAKAAPERPVVKQAAPKKVTAPTGLEEAQVNPYSHVGLGVRAREQGLPGTVPELRQLAKRQGVPNYQKLRKDQLLFELLGPKLTPGDKTGRDELLHREARARIIGEGVERPRVTRAARKAVPEAVPEAPAPAKRVRKVAAKAVPEAAPEAPAKRVRKAAVKKALPNTDAEKQRLRDEIKKASRIKNSGVRRRRMQDRLVGLETADHAEEAAPADLTPAQRKIWADSYRRTVHERGLGHEVADQEANIDVAKHVLAKGAPKKAARELVPAAESSVPRRLASRPRPSAQALREEQGSRRAGLEARLTSNQKKELEDLDPKQRARYWVRRMEAGDDHNAALSKAAPAKAEPEVAAPQAPAVKRAPRKVAAPKKVAAQAAPEAAKAQPTKKLTTVQQRSVDGLSPRARTTYDTLTSPGYWKGPESHQSAMKEARRVERIEGVVAQIREADDIGTVDRLVSRIRHDDLSLAESIATEDNPQRRLAIGFGSGPDDQRRNFLRNILTKRETMSKAAKAAREAGEAKATRPTVTRAAKAAPRMTREQLMEEINRRRDAGEDLHAYDRTFTRDELERVLKGESVELRGSQRRKAAKARAVARAEEAAQAPPRPARSTGLTSREALDSLAKVETQDEAKPILDQVRSKEQMRLLLRAQGHSPASDADLRSMRKQALEGYLPVPKRAGDLVRKAELTPEPRGPKVTARNVRGGDVAVWNDNGTLRRGLVVDEGPRRRFVDWDDGRRERLGSVQRSPGVNFFRAESEERPVVRRTAPRKIATKAAAKATEAETAARARGESFDKARSDAHIASNLDQVIHDQGSDDAIRHWIDNADKPNAMAKLQGISAEDKATLRKAFDTRGREGLQKALGAYERKHGLKRIGNTGDVVPFDPERHRALGRVGQGLQAGDPVRILRPGHEAKAPGDRTMSVAEPARVMPERATRKVAKAAPEAARPRVTRPAKKAAPEAPAKTAPARKVAAKAAPEAPAKATRPVVKRAATKAAPAPESKELKPLANGTRRKSMTNVQEGDVVRGASGARGGSEVPRKVTKVERDGNNITITRDDGSTLKGTTNTAVWLGEAPKSEAPVTKRAVKKAAPTAPEAPAKATRPVVKRAGTAAKKAAPEAAPEAPTKAVRPAKKVAGPSPKDLSNPEVQRARGSLLGQGDRSLTDDAVAKEMARLKVQDNIDAAHLATTTRKIDQNVPLKGDPQGDGGLMHGDSPSMQLAQKLAKRGNRNGSANRIMELRHEYSGRQGRQNPDATQNAVDEIRRMRLEESDPEVRKLYDQAISEMDAEHKPVPDLPASTPPGARKLIEDLNRIPLARRLEDHDGRRVSAVTQLAEVYHDIDSGHENALRNADSRISSILHRYHESRDGAYQMWDLQGRTQEYGLGGVGREIRQWMRERHAVGGPSAPAAKKTAPSAPETPAARPRVTRAKKTAPEAPAVRSTEAPTPGGTKVTRAQQRLDAREAHQRRSTADGSAELADTLNQVIEAGRSNKNPREFRRIVRQRLITTPGEKGDPKTEGYSDLRRALERETFTTPEELETRLRQELSKRGITMTSTPGAQTRFNPDLHRSLGGDIPDNADVEVVRPGLIFTDKDGTVVTLQKPVVKRLESEPGPTSTLDRAVDKIFGTPKSPPKISHRSTQEPLTGDETTRLTGDILTEDTDPRGIPVRNFTSLMGGGYTIKNGTAWRRNGVTYIVEHDETGEGKRAAIEAAKALQEHHQSIPAGARQYQRAYTWHMGSNPQDPVTAQKLGRKKFVSVASASRGDTNIWQPGVVLNDKGEVNLTQLFSDLNHEYGHNADIRMPGSNARVSGTTRWLEAGSTADPSRFIDLSTWHPSVAHGGRARGIVFQPDPETHYPHGVTVYGRSSEREDFAEAVDLYLQGFIGYATLRQRSGGYSHVMFRDLFPERAAVLDQLFPEVAQQQLAQIARRRPIAPRA